ncbi:rRNA adenine N-6-methyltransferase family protein [Streptomyces sp. Wh19]|uniref:rRNA adenine N-6-methyltransferase family protein n=1 Tax=Streptomyces sp. Wh19 TaxID=3076629 RepID=UPI0029588CDA|nr:rRNA adenine N-6-methyltransferase family protein [Streptomyces sp. Wh19]MDV9194635.1 rRNA adenine N-6-methyltransferase family protein [Streptomyces sp. Wh19]
MIKQPLTVDEVVGVADRYAALGFQTRGDLGQHFLRTLDAAHALLEQAEIPAGAHVLEVGAGLGTLSSTIATAGHRIWAVEKDERLRTHLTERLAPFGPQARVTFDDVRRIDLDDGLDLGSALVSIMPFDPELSADLIRHVFTCPRVEYGLVVVPSTSIQLLTRLPDLVVEEVDGIARSSFWPPAPTVLRVLAIGRRSTCRS